MYTTEELLKLKEAYAAWFAPGDEMDLSEVASDVTKLIDELFATRKRAEKAEAALAQADKYGSRMWESGTSGNNYLTFAEWQRATQSARV